MASGSKLSDEELSVLAKMANKAQFRAPAGRGSDATDLSSDEYAEKVDEILASETRR